MVQLGQDLLAADQPDFADPGSISRPICSGVACRSAGTAAAASGLAVCEPVSFSAATPSCAFSSRSWTAFSSGAGRFPVRRGAGPGTRRRPGALRQRCPGLPSLRSARCGPIRETARPPPPSVRTVPRAPVRPRRAGCRTRRSAQRLQPQVVEFVAVFVDPARLEPGQQPAGKDLLGFARQLVGLPVPTGRFIQASLFDPGLGCLPPTQASSPRASSSSSGLEPPRPGPCAGAKEGRQQCLSATWQAPSAQSASTSSSV